MAINRNKLYSILLIACLAGYIWLYFSMTTNRTESKSVELCLIKHATNIPCPSCGSTRSVISLIKGNFVEAFKLNPMGYIVAAIMVVAPIWIVTDLVCRSNSLFNFYLKTENYLKKTKYAIFLILLVIINWIWNITKEL